MNQIRIQMLEQRIKEFSDDPFYIYALALEYKESEPKKCLELLEETQNKFPKYLPTYYQLAEILQEFKQKEKAMIIYELGIELAQSQSEIKILAELKNAKQNLLFEED